MPGRRARARPRRTCRRAHPRTPAGDRTPSRCRSPSRRLLPSRRLARKVVLRRFPRETLRATRSPSTCTTRFPSTCTTKPGGRRSLRRNPSRSPRPAPPPPPPARALRSLCPMLRLRRPNRRSQLRLLRRLSSRSVRRLRRSLSHRPPHPRRPNRSRARRLPRRPMLPANQRAATQLRTGQRPSRSSSRRASAAASSSGRFRDAALDGLPHSAGRRASYRRESPPRSARTRGSRRRAPPARPFAFAPLSACAPRPRLRVRSLLPARLRLRPSGSAGSFRVSFRTTCSFGSHMIRPKRSARLICGARQPDRPPALRPKAPRR